MLVPVQEDVPFFPTGSGRPNQNKLLKQQQRLNQDDFRGEEQPRQQAAPQLPGGSAHPLAEEEAGQTGEEGQQWVAAVSQGS